MSGISTAPFFARSLASSLKQATVTARPRWRCPRARRAQSSTPSTIARPGTDCSFSTSLGTPSIEYALSSDNRSTTRREMLALTAVGTLPDRSAVATACTPRERPSPQDAHEHVVEGNALRGSLPPGSERTEPIHEQQDARLRFAGDTPILGEVRGIHGTERLASLVEYVADGTHQALDTLHVIPCDDGTDVWQHFERAQGAGTEVQAVHLGQSEIGRIPAEMAIVRRAVDLPEPLVPYMSMAPSRSGTKYRASCCCFSGRSALPSRIFESLPTGSSMMSTVGARSSSQGRRGGGMCASVAAAIRVLTSRFCRRGRRGLPRGCPTAGILPREERPKRSSAILTSAWPARCSSTRRHTPTGTRPTTWTGLRRGASRE